MSKFKKLTDFLKSLKCRLILLCILIGIVPSVLLRAGMLGSYENRAVSIRTSEILSQAKILANQIVSNDYLNNAESESAINVQLEQLSTIYDGRVMIIDEEFHIIKDTYNLDTGKTIISEEVIKSIQGEEISKYDSQNRYIEMTIPLVHVDPETENKRDDRCDYGERFDRQHQSESGISGAQYACHGTDCDRGDHLCGNVYRDSSCGAVPCHGKVDRGDSDGIWG